ncbi:MAG TPA: hypothetical protein VMT73_08690 [Anaerolineales bacterium]|nr:hypothetical protein [Anaerolineales bacterium]
MKRRIFLSVFFVLLISLACKAFSGTPSMTASENSPTSVPTQSATATPNTNQPVLGQILFQDDFSDPNSGWTTTDQDFIALDYFDGGYRATVKRSYIASFSAFPNLQFDNVSIEADAQFLTGPNSSLFGLICRATANPDLQSGYQMLITPNGEASIVKITGVKAGQEKVLSSGTSPLVHAGAAMNHLRMNCSGDHISMYVNGERLVQVTDSDYPQGRVGFAFGANYDPGFQVLFDNFVVRQANP